MTARKTEANAWSATLMALYAGGRTSACQQRCIHLVGVVGREANHGRRPGSTPVGTEKFHLV